jgi:hypothetical protein
LIPESRWIDSRAADIQILGTGRRPADGTEEEALRHGGTVFILSRAIFAIHYEGNHQSIFEDASELIVI